MSKKNVPNRSAFTLIELLVAISILGFISGMFLVAYRGAAQESNIQKTRTTIQKISEVLNARMDEYVNFPISLRTASGVLPPNVVSWDTAINGESVTILRERARLFALRDLIRMEMPDHPDDLKFTTFWWSSLSSTAYPENLPRAVSTGLGTSVALANPGFSVAAPVTSRVKALITRLRDPSPPAKPRLNWDEFNANEELLFLIVEGSELDGTSAIELFGKSEIADTDNDGLNEFVDAFGKPIRWIRWPAGFSGATRFYPDMLDPKLVDGGRLLVNSEPLDRLGTDPGWHTTVQKPGTGLSPLVISAGQDGAFGIRFREINRYSPPPSPYEPPRRVGQFSSIDSYSSAEAPWSDPAKYGPRGFTDPWFPRDPSDIDNQAPRTLPDTVSGVRMGETVTGKPWDLENGKPVGPFNAGDNISNFEGTAVSL